MYFEYPLSSIHGKKILDATMKVYQEWTFTCDPHWYDLSRVDAGISSSTTLVLPPHRSRSDGRSVRGLRAGRSAQPVAAGELGALQ
ncbi:hypothetical protein ACWDE9_34425 [Streptomyces olivaceoviridis]